MRVRVGGVKAMSPFRDLSHREPVPRARQSGHTADVIRYSVQADSRDECIEGLERLVQFGLVPVMLPAQVGGDRWMARAIPASTPAPVAEPAAE